MGQTVLEMIGIKKSFSGIYALSGIDFSLELGEVHALLGENGAGKSTLIKVLGGIYQPDSGIIKVNGKEVKINGVPAARENGIGIIHQEIVLVPYLSVAQNLFLGREIRTKLGTLDFAEMNRRAEEMISSLGVNIKADTIVENLTIAQQQMVEIVKAVSFNGKIIVMDEPTSSLSNEEVEQLFEIIENLRKKQVSIIYISHRMEELFRISDRVTVIRDGAYVGTKKTSETSPNELVAMMVGRDLESFYARDYCDMDKAEVALEVKNLSQTGVFEDISFSVHKGEILGFSGLVGAGRSEIMEAVFGATRPTSGEVILGGKPVHFKNPMQAIKAGIALVPEDRKKQGLVLGNSVAFNLTLSSLRFYMNGIAISEKKRGEVIDHYSQRLRIKAASPEIEAGSLSGGNQQKLIIARELNNHAKVIVASQPTRGLDIGATEFVRQQLIDQRNAGKGVMLISADLEEIMALSDRIAVLFGGKIVGILNREEATVQKIGLLMGGISEEEAR